MLHIRAMAGTALAAALLPQVPTPPPLTRSTPDARQPTVEETYGPARPEDLAQIAYNGDSYHRRNVIVRGMLEPLVPDQYLALSDGSARLMLIPLQPGEIREYLGLMGRDVEVTGIVRVFRTQDPRDDPSLPALPSPRIEWPKVTITVLKIVDHGSGEMARRDGARAPADTGLQAAAADGKPVTTVGQFRGANLCRDLPEPTRRDPDDWVLLTTEGPVWVSGRPPEGRGFRLDPSQRGDVKRWLEVNGRVSASAGVLYLRASKVALVVRPPAAEPAPCAP